jgi:hypothetical protein
LVSNSGLVIACNYSCEAAKANHPITMTFANRVVFRGLAWLLNCYSS